MAKLIHTADLHLKAGDEKAYCFNVLDEIIALALSEKARFLIFAGDLFDSFSDFEALRREVCLKLKSPADAGCETIYIPGNHEARGGSAPLSAYNLDPVKFYARPPFVFTEADGVEFLCVPHSENYDGYRDWKVPAKKPGVARVAVLHALNSAIYTGPDPETDAATGVIDDDFFKRFSIDYAAMGHVHAGRRQRLGGAIACYPGSPRVWRAHIREAGPKSVCVVETGGPSSFAPAPPEASKGRGPAKLVLSEAGPAVTVRTAEIRSAGQYREFTLPLDLNGAPAEAAVKKLELGANKLDLVRVTLTGVVEDENAAKAAAGTLERRLRAWLRQAYVELETTVAADISANSLAKALLAEFDLVKPPEAQGTEYRKWLLARQYGLEALAARIRDK